ncbi:cupin domain-containing protein [Chitinasiproducens palmae]|uniref:Anti-sigma factor ChrR, cupin superfamily n=1 Tax=Chitinasiproducens palmae TaxID=1770053 RepID=A0A1H2PT57_9BURK|nr:cupin domain-containing protein [Chitinasiproducens palmae]SDV50257.1 Anti-sigma factor ChrR, cupin superfamily [Chitinasiproducens palmae]
MLVNADFASRATVTPDQYRWVASPQRGVERVMLDRLGGENARATSIVRYAAASSFPRHAHPGGEEILVLSGTFSEQEADYPAGWYLRNPPGSSHQPCSGDGAVIFVKLQQMRSPREAPVRIDTRASSNWHRDDGRMVCPLFASESERVALQRVEAGSALLTDPVAGAELLVIDGVLRAGGQCFPCGSWLRLPAGHYPTLVADEGGVTVYLRIGAHVDAALEA